MKDVNISGVVTFTWGVITGLVVSLIIWWLAWLT